MTEKVSFLFIIINLLVTERMGDETFSDELSTQMFQNTRNNCYKCVSFFIFVCVCVNISAPNARVHWQQLNEISRNFIPVYVLL